MDLEGLMGTAAARVRRINIHGELFFSHLLAELAGRSSFARARPQLITQTSFLQSFAEYAFECLMLYSLYC